MRPLLRVHRCGPPRLKRTGRADRRAAGACGGDDHRIRNAGECGQAERRTGRTAGHGRVRSGVERRPAVLARPGARRCADPQLAPSGLLVQRAGGWHLRDRASPHGGAGFRHLPCVPRRSAGRRRRGLRAGCGAARAESRLPAAEGRRSRDRNHRVCQVAGRERLRRRPRQARSAAGCRDHRPATSRPAHSDRRS
jgi:hypothetical protein